MSKYGLNKRPSYEQIVNYIESDPVIARYPNREATMFMNSPQFQNLSNEGSIDLQKQSDDLAKQKQKEELVRERVRHGDVETHRISTPHGSGSPSHYSSAASEPDTAEAEGDVHMGLMFHGFEREMQRQRAAAMGSLLLGSIQQSPEAAAAATAASASTPYRALAPPPLIRDPNATASAVVPKKRTDAAASSSSPAPTVELSRGFSATPLNPFVDPTRLPTVTPDVSRFIQNVMTAARQMPTAPPRPPGQDLLITFLQKKHQEQLALPSQPQKRRPAELQGRPAAKQKTDGQEQEQAKEASSGASSSRETPAIRTKGKIQEVHVVGKKLTSTNYNAWEALTPLQLEEQLSKYYGYKHKWDLKNASRYKNQMLEFAVKTVPLRKGKSTPQDS